MLPEVAAGGLAWLAEGRRFAAATVLSTWASAPRPAGAVMLVDDRGAVLGGVSGGCVEADVVAVAEQVLADEVAQRRRYGVADDDAFAVGLMCGGSIDVLVEPAFPEFAAWARAVSARRPVALAIAPGPAPAHAVVDGTGSWCATADEGLTGAARSALGRSVAELRDGRDGEVFVVSASPRPWLLVAGAVDFAAALAVAAAPLAYRTTVCDPRPAFTTAARFPAADEVVVADPAGFLADRVAESEVDASTAVVSLSHRARFETPLLAAALASPAGYVGAMGSRRTHRERLGRLREAGVAEGSLARLHSPIGLDLGAVTPAETAVSILAEILAVRYGHGGRALSEGTGTIHA